MSYAISCVINYYRLQMPWISVVDFVIISLLAYEIDIDYITSKGSIFNINVEIRQPSFSILSTEKGHWIINTSVSLIPASLTTIIKLCSCVYRCPNILLGWLCDAYHDVSVSKVLFLSHFVHQLNIQSHEDFWALYLVSLIKNTAIHTKYHWL